MSPAVRRDPFEEFRTRREQEHVEKRARGEEGELRPVKPPPVGRARKIYRPLSGR
ncbi:MAG: hypothetical protein L0216_10915 [Planctomycetales bacterium]|nr:hypothetical protein [Planctomycetales bacterium]